jgi:hypothetical protein
VVAAAQVEETCILRRGGGHRAIMRRPREENTQIGASWMARFCGLKWARFVLAVSRDNKTPSRSKGLLLPPPGNGVG